MMWLLIDGNNWFAQCDYASMQDSRVTLMRRLETVLNQVDHTRCVVCWDQGDSWRREIYADYKTGRNTKPDGYEVRLEKARAEIEALPNVESAASDGYEADDVIATLVNNASEEGERCIMFSADRDLHQLLSDGSVTQVIKVERVTPVRMQFIAVTACLLFQKFGVHPDQWIDYRSLVGDKSDGIPGCEGFGKVAARNLLEWKRRLDQFYDNPWGAPITNRQRRLLIEYRSQLPTIHKLLTLVQSVPLPARLMEVKA